MKTACLLSLTLPTSSLQLSHEESLRLSHTDDGLLLEIPSQHILAQSKQSARLDGRPLSLPQSHVGGVIEKSSVFQISGNISNPSFWSGVVTRVASDTFREVQLHLDTGELYFIGEKSHGFDLYTSSGNHLWWCYMNTTSKGSGLLEYVMEHQGQAATDKESAIEAGWHTYTADKYRFLKLEPLEGQKPLSTKKAPSKQVKQIRHELIQRITGPLITKHFFLYQNSQNGHIYLGAGAIQWNVRQGSYPRETGLLKRTTD